MRPSRPRSLPMLSLSKIRCSSRLRSLNLFLHSRHGSMAAPASHQAVANSVKTNTPHWPLSFSLQLPKSRPKTLRTYGFSSKQAAPPTWWNHRLYRGPEGKEVEVLYSKTKAESEAIAQRFLGEPIIGFDMEWPWNDWTNDKLQNKIGLIQIASEDKIGLFHIGLHPGITSADIIAPTLKKLIEDPDVGKVGVHILGADFSRLSKYFGLKPKGAIELSHLYRLVKFGPWKPELVSVKLVSLAQQVEVQLGLPLYKGDVRTSNWSKPLSHEQIDYAAGDAYAGYMLYKCMNAKRLAMRPTPPHPIHAENYPGGKTSRDDPIILNVGDGTTITTEEFFGVKPTKSALPASRAAVPQPIAEPLDATSQALYDELVLRRALVAEKAGIQPGQVIYDSLLRAIAQARPHNTRTLLGVKGIGKVQQSKYGDEWIEVILLFLKANGIEHPVSPTESKTKAARAPRASRQPRERRRASTDSSSSSSPAFDDEVPKAPELHTGLSFTLAESKLDDPSVAPNNPEPDYNSDSSLPSLDFGTPPPITRVISGAKRKRSETLTTSPQQQQQQKLDAPTHGSPVQTSRSETQPTALPPSHSPQPPAPGVSPSASRRAGAAATTTAPTTSQSTRNRKPQARTPFSNHPSITHAMSLSQAAHNAATQVWRHQKPSRTSAVETDLQPEDRIAKSKLLAFSRLVARKLAEQQKKVDGGNATTAAAATAGPPLVDSHTLDLIVMVRPQMQADLERIPGIDRLVLACDKTGMNLLKNVVKFVGGKGGN